MLILIAFSFLAGIFTALSPCILPVLPAIMAAGVSEGKLRPLGTILGLVCSFSFFTLALSWIVQITGFSPYILRYFAIALIFLFGLIMIFPRLSNWFSTVTAPIAGLGQQVQGTQVNQGFWGGIVFGAALGLLWTPCAGPILAAITALVATRAVDITAILMTVAYSLGAGIPLFFIAYGSGKIVRASRLLSKHSEMIRQFFGMLMILFSLLLFFNWDMLLNEKLARIFPEIFLEKKLPVEKVLKEVGGGENLSLNEPSPEITHPDGWVNSPPLAISQLKGKVVLIDFWTYSCINCLRTLPYLKKWYKDYKDKGLVIIGVHTPEFEFEKDIGNVKKAVAQLGVDYPVVLDNHYGTWKAFHNNYWPAHYLIDQQGNIRSIHYGEGGYVETENDIRGLLGLAPLKMEEPKRSIRPISPETYLGNFRGQSYKMNIVPGETFDYSYLPPLGSHQVGLKGPWRSENEFIEAESDKSYLDLNFLASRVYLVLSDSSKTPMEVFLDGKLYGRIDIDSDRKYDIVSTSYGQHQLSLKVPKGVKAYAFTFGDE